MHLSEEEGVAITGSSVSGGFWQWITVSFWQVKSRGIAGENASVDLPDRRYLNNSRHRD